MPETPAEAVRRLIPTGPIDSPLPKNNAFYRKPRTPVEGLSIETDNNKGRRIRTTVHSEGIEEIDVGPASGGDVRAVPSFGEVSASETDDMFKAMEQKPIRRPESADTKGLYERGLEESLHRRGGRKVFGMPRRAWKGE